MDAVAGGGYRETAQGSRWAIWTSCARPIALGYQCWRPCPVFKLTEDRTRQDETDDTGQSAAGRATLP
jgi:hypothetical protein